MSRAEEVEKQARKAATDATNARSALAKATEADDSAHRSLADAERELLELETKIVAAENYDDEAFRTVAQLRLVVQAKVFSLKAKQSAARQWRDLEAVRVETTRLAASESNRARAIAIARELDGTLVAVAIRFEETFREGRKILEGLLRIVQPPPAPNQQQSMLTPWEDFGTTLGHRWFSQGPGEDSIKAFESIIQTSRERKSKS